MTIKTILVPLAAREGSEAVLTTALAAAQDKVTLLTSRKREDNTKDLAQQLLWHDIKALVHVFETGSRSVGETLLRECKKINADLLVVGGYTRTRARQLLFGGVTSYVLVDADIPVFVAH